MFLAGVSTPRRYLPELKLKKAGFPSSLGGIAIALGYNPRPLTNGGPDGRAEWYF